MPLALLMVRLCDREIFVVVGWVRTLAGCIVVGVSHVGPGALRFADVFAA